MTGAELKQIRVKLKLSQESLAYLLGIKQPAISKWEHGAKIAHPKMLKLALQTIAREGMVK